MGLVQAKLRIMKPLRLIFSVTALLALFVSLPASAQYQWLDANGRKVYSDQPPPANVPQKKILQQPGHAAPVAATSSASSASKAPAANPPAAVKDVQETKDKPVDKDLEAKKKQADDAEAAKQKAEIETQAKVKAENCERAKNAKKTLDSGVRISQTNAKGERSYMDDAARMVENKRVQDIIQTDCK